MYLGWIVSQSFGVSLLCSDCEVNNELTHSRVSFVSRQWMANTRAMSGAERRQENEHYHLMQQMRERELQRLSTARTARRRAGIRNEYASEEDERRVPSLRLEIDDYRSGAPRVDTGEVRDVMRRGIRDEADGVRRCVDCNWEIEDGRCEHW